MTKKFVLFFTLVFAGSYLAGRYDLWWVAIIYSGALYWFFFIKKQWSKTGLVRKETPESAWCNLRLKSVFNESLGIYR